MKPLVILGVLFAALPAAAQSVRQQPLQQPLTSPPPSLSGPLKIDPKIPLNLDGSPALPTPGTQADTGLHWPTEKGATLAPGLWTPPTPDTLPQDHRQDLMPTPTLRLKVPL